MNTAAVDRVLLVDDDKVTNLMHKRLLTKAALAQHIDVVTDGEAALAYLEARAASNAAPPDIIFLDLNMPRMNGFEFLDAFKDVPAQMREGVEVFMLSTSVLHDDQMRAEADPDVIQFMTKPIRQDQLQNLFEGYHARASG